MGEGEKIIDAVTRGHGVKAVSEHIDLATERLGEKTISSFRAEPKVRTRNPE